MEISRASGTDIPCNISEEERKQKTNGITVFAIGEDGEIKKEG